MQERGSRPGGCGSSEVSGYRARVWPATRELWERQDRHPGDRARLFRVVAKATGARTVLYPGSYVDVAASFAFEAVTYVDTDARAARFFADVEGVRELVAEQPGAPADPEITFLARDYTRALDLPDGSFDLLVSLYSGPLSEHCTRYLRPGGRFLASTSHGDVALAALDSRYRLDGVVLAGAGGYRVSSTDLDTYLVPARRTPVTREAILRSGRGVRYTRSAAAYLFTRVP